MSAERILRNAARIVDERRIGGCEAISLAAYDISERFPARQLFNKFEPLVPTRLFWWGRPRSANDIDHNARVMALLFAAEMAKDEGK